MKTNAFVLRAHTISNPATGDLCLSTCDVVELPVTQFEDFRSVGLVREATEAEVAAAKKASKAK
jgi:hypothetical protein